MSALLVTGGAGFIGTNFLRSRSEQSEDKIVVLDSLTYAGNLANIDDLIRSGQLEFVRGSICDASLLEDIFARHDISSVINFAAESHVDRSIAGPQSFIDTNIVGTYCLLHAAKLAWREADEANRFLHVSTDETFGSLNEYEEPFTEQSPYKPSSPYSASKAASDHLVMAWYRTYGLPVIISNCSNNYGPWQFPEKLIPLIIMNCADSRALPVYGDGRHRRDWLHVQDHCDALDLLLENGEIGQSYCIGGGDEKANIEIVEAVCDLVDGALGRTIGSSRDLIKFVDDRLGHDRRYAINSKKIRNELGWTPKRSIENDLASVVQWYLENKVWADSIRSGEYKKYYRKQYGEI